MNGTETSTPAVSMVPSRPRPLSSLSLLLSTEGLDRDLLVRYQQDLPELFHWIDLRVKNESSLLNTPAAPASKQFLDSNGTDADVDDVPIIGTGSTNHGPPDPGNGDDTEPVEETTTRTTEIDPTPHRRCPTTTSPSPAPPPTTPPNDAERQNRYVDALVSFGGRPTNAHRIIVETMYQYYYSDHHDDNNEEDENDSTTPSVVPTLSSFLYRLCLVYLELSPNHPYHRTKDLVPSPLPPPPPEWDAYVSIRHGRATPPQLQPPTMAEWKQWIRRYAPMIPVMVSTVTSCLYLSLSSQPPPPPISEQETVCIPSTQTNLPLWMTTNASIIPMQLTIMGLGGGNGGIWRSIYQSTIHGTSFTTLTHQLLSYYGPTVLIIETTRNEIFGYYTKVPWKVSNRWYTTTSTTTTAPNKHHGNDNDDQEDDIVDEENDDDDESFLFRLYPCWNVYRPQMESRIVPKRFHQYLNPPSLKNNRRDTLVGLAVGGVADHVPRLHITPSFERCKACIWDSVFDTGPLLNNDDESYFDIFNLEVWAVTKYNGNNNTSSSGTDHQHYDDIYEQGKRMGADRTGTMEQIRQRCAKVDRKQFVDDLIHGTVLPNSLFQHRWQTRGRADFVVASDNVHDGYAIDGKQPSPR